jgi:bifunctional non-homologous end joining protein LigD
MAACLHAESVVLDGEIVYLDSDGRPEFYNVVRLQTPQHFYAFDILWLEGKDLRGLPLVTSKQILRRVVLHSAGPTLICGSP